MREDWIAALVAAIDVPVERVLVFGSRARAEHVDWSDYDVAVVSEAFRGLSSVDRAERVLRGWRGHRGLDAVGLTPEELRASPSPLCEAIRREGRQVWPREGGAPAAALSAPAR